MRLFVKNLNIIGILFIFVSAGGLFVTGISTNQIKYIYASACVSFIALIFITYLCYHNRHNNIELPQQPIHIYHDPTMNMKRNKSDTNLELINSP